MSHILMQASFEGILNLSPWACREIQIQLQAVNKYGEADHGFGPKTSLTVYPYGGIYRYHSVIIRECLGSMHLLKKKTGCTVLYVL